MILTSFTIREPLRKMFINRRSKIELSSQLITSSLLLLLWKDS